MIEPQKCYGNVKGKSWTQKPICIGSLYLYENSRNIKTLDTGSRSP